MVASTRNAMRKFKDFSLSISNLRCEEWRHVDCIISIKHVPSGKRTRRPLRLSKDDYLFAAAGIAGSRTNFLESDPKRIAEFLLSRVRLKFYRRTNKTWGKKPQHVGICIEEILLTNWDDEDEQFNAMNVTGL